MTMTGGRFNSSVREVLSMLECGGREYNHLFDCPHAGLTGQEQLMHTCFVVQEEVGVSKTAVHTHTVATMGMFSSPLWHTKFP